MDGQLSITDWLSTQIENRKVLDLTAWINNQGKAQYGQVKDLIRETGIISDEEQLDRLTNHISCYILRMSIGYMDYLRESNGDI